MKTIIRSFLFSLFALWLISKIVAGFKIIGDWQTYCFAAIVFSLINTFIKPILNLVFLPISLVSLGLLSWLVNVVILYLLQYFVPQIQISSWKFPGFSYQGFVIPSLYLNQIANFILVAFLLSIIINFLDWLVK